MKKEQKNAYKKFRRVKVEILKRKRAENDIN
jgi:hypothetical protein